MSIKQKLKNLFYSALGKNPEAVVLTFHSGDPELSRRMEEEVRALLPDRRHIRLTEADCSSISDLRQRFRRYRIGMAAVLFDGDRRYRGMRRQAFLLAPTRILAYNRTLERHHLRLRTWIASLLFLRGVPLDRIFLRPAWLFPFRRDRSIAPRNFQLIEGAPARPGRTRVAVVAPYFPYPLSHGGAVRMFHLLREAAVEFDIWLYAFGNTESAADIEPVRHFCSRIYLLDRPRYRSPRWSSLRPPEVCEFRSQLMSKLLRQARANGVRLVQVEYTQLASISGDILVEHDITFDLFRQVHQRRKTLASWWNFTRWRVYEWLALRRYQRAVVMSEKDAQLAGLRTAVVIPNGVDLERFRPSPQANGKRLLFVGSFAHFPNVLAYQLLVERLLPLVRQRHPDATLTVISGRDPLLHWRSATGMPDLPQVEGVEFHGFIADVYPFYVAADVVVVPTVVSAGTNLKVLEAMACGRAVVSTTSGCAGLGLVHGESVWIADEAGEFAAGVVRLLEDEDLRVRIASAARLHAERRFGWPALGALQRQLWRELLGLPEIRRATHDDIEAMARIQGNASDAAQWQPQQYLDYDATVAVQAGAVIGFLISRETGAHEREILNLAVDVRWRRQGVARRLIRSELERGAAEVFLEVRESNTAARKLYETLGFVEIGTRQQYYDSPPEHAIVMRFRS